MNVLVTSSQESLSIQMEGVEHLVKTFLKWKKISCDEVAVHFVDKKEITRLHDLHFGDPTPTDCISFPIDSPGESSGGYQILGEVFVCPEVGQAFAKEHGGDPYEEVSLYVVHGLLHLLGFDDQDEASLEIMRGEEKSAMHYLKENEALLHE